MKYLVFLFCALAYSQSAVPLGSSDAQTFRGQVPCSATVTDNCRTTISGGVVYGGGSGTGDVAGPAASVDAEIALFNGVSGKLIKRMTGTGIVLSVAGVATVDSGLQFNTTTKSMGVFGPIVSGQNSTYQGKLQLRGLTSGVSTLSADADGSGMSLDGNLTITGTLTAGASGAMDLTAIVAPATPAAGIGSVYVDSTSKNLAVKDDAGVVKHGVQTKAAVSNQFVTAISAAGVVATAAIAAADLPSTLTSGTAITNAALTTPSIGAATGTSLLATGIVNGLAPIAINTGADPCPTGTHCAFGTTYKSGYVFNQQTAADRIYIDLPTAEAGLQWCIKNSVVGGTGAAVTGIITVKAQTGDYINNDGTIGSSGGVLSSAGAAGDGACFVASAANHWEGFISRGTWAP